MADIETGIEFELSAVKLMDIREIDFSTIEKCLSQPCGDYWDRYWSLDIDVLFRGSF